VERCISQVKKSWNDQLTKKSAPVTSSSLHEGGENEAVVCNRWGLTYHPNIFEEIKRKVKQFDIELVAGNYANLKRQLTHVKDVTPLQEVKGAVYKLNCKDCDTVYVGETGQKLTSRIYRHQLAGKNKDVEHYPLVEHCLNTGHSTDWSNVEVLTSENNRTKRKLMESFFY